ncbi:BTB/POZ domain-containing protein 16, partial [Anabarilius grahami]
SLNVFNVWEQDVDCQSAPVKALFGFKQNAHPVESFIFQEYATQTSHKVSARSLGQRTQAGHTNRWQLPGTVGSDLLGQAQVQRAEEVGIKSSDRKNNSADPMALHWHEDATSCPQSPLPRLVHPLSASRRTRLCKDATWSSKLDTPEERFYVLSRGVAHNAKPDAVLECLGVRWELHCSIMSSSDTLFELYTNSKRQRDFELQKRAVIGKDSRVSSSACERGLVYRKWLLSGPLSLRLHVKDASINKEALSFALRTLYDPAERPDEWGEAILSTAALLGMSNLFQNFHQVSCKLKETFLQRTCERWLELFLVTELSFHIKLKDLPFDLLLKTLRSPRLFASNEYEVLRAVLYWLYLKLNPLRETLPAHSIIIHFFSRETAVFLEQPQGQKYITIFQALRMHGITEWQHLQELQNIRVLPESWLLSILSNHYHTLYSGGDMVVTDFSKQAIRFGMMFHMVRSDRLATSTLWAAVIWLMQPQNSFPPLEMCCSAIVFRGCELREEEACFAWCALCFHMGKLPLRKQSYPDHNTCWKMLSGPVRIYSSRPQTTCMTP